MSKIEAAGAWAAISAIADSRVPHRLQRPRLQNARVPQPDGGQLQDCAGQGFAVCLFNDRSAGCGSIDDRSARLVVDLLKDTKIGQSQKRARLRSVA